MNFERKIISRKLELQIEQFVNIASSPQNRTLPLLLRSQTLALMVMVDVEVELRDLVDLTAEVALEEVDLEVIDLVVVDLEVIDVVQVVLVDVLSVKWLRC